jgi:hypothetical protein
MTGSPLHFGSYIEAMPVSHLPSPSTTEGKYRRNTRRARAGCQQLCTATAHKILQPWAMSMGAGAGTSKPPRRHRKLQGMQPKGNRKREQKTSEKQKIRALEDAVAQFVCITASQCRVVSYR